MWTSQDREWVRTVAVVWTAELIALMGMSLVIPFLPLYLTELGVSEGQTQLWAGWVGGANFLCAALVAPLWGSIADRFGRKPMAIRALIGLAVSVGLMAYVQNVYQLFGLRMLQGAFGGFVAAAIALVGVSVPRERLGAALGFLQTAVVGGNLIGPLLGGELAHRFGYRNTFKITGAALVVAMLLILFLVRERHAPEAGQQKGVRANVSELLRIPQIRWLIAAVLFSQWGLMLINPQITLFVKQLVGDAGHVDRLAGSVMAAPALSSFLAAPLWGRWGDRRGHAWALSWALFGAALLAPWAGFVHLYWQLFVLRFAMGAFTSAVNPATHSAVAHSVDESRTASAFSLISSAQMLGSCAGPFLSGPVAWAVGIRPLFPITGALLLLGAFAAWQAAVWARTTEESNSQAA